MNIEDLKMAISKYRPHDSNVVLSLKGELVTVKSDEIIPKLLEEYNLKQ